MQQLGLEKTTIHRLLLIVSRDRLTNGHQVWDLIISTVFKGVKQINIHRIFFKITPKFFLGLASLITIYL